MHNLQTAMNRIQFAAEVKAFFEEQQVRAPQEQFKVC
jgi:hypothetical protein